MAHNLEIRADGTASFVGARESAWHRLGKIYEDRDGLTIAEDLDCGTIMTGPVHGTLITEDGVAQVPDSTRKMTMRVRTGGEITPLGVVKQRYQVVQESEAFGFIDAVVDAGEGIVSSAGLLDGGRRAFCCLKLPSNILIGGVDAVDMYVFIATSHDGTLATTAAATPIRVVCQNTLTYGLQQATHVWKVRHSTNALGRISEARRALDLTFKYEEAWKVEAEKLIAIKITKRHFERMAGKLFPAPKADAAKLSKLAHEKTMDTLMGLWTADTQVDIKNTAWGAFNAFVEFEDWFTGTRGQDDALAQQFYTSLTSGHGTVRTKADFKDKALAVVNAATK